jgi:hypothetical protein
VNRTGNEVMDFDDVNGMQTRTALGDTKEFHIYQPHVGVIKLIRDRHCISPVPIQTSRLVNTLNAGKNFASSFTQEKRPASHDFCSTRKPECPSPSALSLLGCIPVPPSITNEVK